MKLYSSFSVFFTRNDFFARVRDFSKFGFYNYAAQQNNSRRTQDLWTQRNLF